MSFFDTLKVNRQSISLAQELLASSNDPYYPLHVILSYLRHLSMLHQTNHWTTSGDPFYGDHQLYQRLYEQAHGEIDAIAEKAVGLGNPQLVSLATSLNVINNIHVCYQRHMVIPRPDELIDSSLTAEVTFLTIAKVCCDVLRENGCMTSGLDNLLAGIQDSHENSVYLLKQRSQTIFSL